LLDANGQPIEIAQQAIFSSRPGFLLTLWSLPLFPYMKMGITPLAAHPWDIALGSGPVTRPD
jgi:muconolactone delta-isomerase